MKSKKSIVNEIFEKLSKEMNFQILFEPFKYVGQITFDNGNKIYFKSSCLDINNYGSSVIANDKDYANFFMQLLGYSIIKGEKFYSDKWANSIKSNETKEKALIYAKEVGYPLIVKPNSGSQGKAVARVDNEQQLIEALHNAFEIDKIVLVQELIYGKDYRVVVMEDKIIAAYERIPLNVTGDGLHTIKELIQIKQEQFKKEGKDIFIKLDDIRIINTLKLQNYTFNSVVSKNTNVRLLINANLSSGGDAIDVSDQISPSIAKMCIQLTKDMGLSLCGVDLMIDYDISKELTKYFILEINSAPGLDNYAMLGYEQKKKVENLYRLILNKLKNKF